MYKRQAKAKASAAVAGPSQPIPYAQLDAYLKASPKARASKDWWSGSAATGMSSDTSATLPATASSTSTDTSVNPSSPSAPAPDSSATLPAAPPASPDATTPPAAPTTPDATTPQTPTEPK